MLVPNGFGLEDIWYYSLKNREYKNGILEELRARGIHYINGLPIEEFFVVIGEDTAPRYELGDII